jgi:hypothetical protein
MRKYHLTIFLLLITAYVGCNGGGGSGGSIQSDESTPMGTLTVKIADSADNGPVGDAVVVVYDASNLLAAKGSTDIDGEFVCSLSPGTFSIRAAAQDYMPVPPNNQDAVPFEIIAGETTTQLIDLTEHPDSGTTGQISGSVWTSMPDPNGLSGVLVVAKDANQNLTASTITGPDGDYMLYNVHPGSYTLEVYLAGYRELFDPVKIDVVIAGEIYVAEEIVMEEHANADIYGHVSFLAVENGVVDITLIHPDTLDTIPGLSTYNDLNNTYRLEGVPPGTFIAWASFRNDGYVMDPDRISKFGLPRVTFTADSTDQEQNFEVTDAVSIIAPTNDEDLVVPVEVNTSTPTFEWEKYPSAKEYIIEAFNSNGETIWGGFDANGLVSHPQIGQAESSVVFNFAGSAIAELQNGETYRWKIYADDDEALDVQNLISSSEHHMGLFKYVQNPN